MNEFKFGNRSQDKLAQVEDNVIKLCELALTESTVDFSIIDGYRTTQEQQQLFRDKKTELDGVARKSAHQSGLAVDVFPYVKYLDMWDTKNAEVAKLWLEVYRSFMRAARKLDLNLEFGVSYNIGGGRDYPHIQIV